MISCVCLHLALLLAGLLVHSPPVDEVAHLVSGVCHVVDGEFDLYAVNPPLVRTLAALPVVIQDPVVDWSLNWGTPWSRSEFALGRRFVSRNSSRIRWLWISSRLVVLLFPVIGMLATVRLGASTGLQGACTFAAALWAISPLMLWTGHMILPDVACAAMGVTSIWLLQLCLRQPTIKTASLLGLGVGVLFATKFTWIVVMPITAAVAGIVWTVTWKSGPASCSTHDGQLTTAGSANRLDCEISVAGYTKQLAASAVFAAVLSLCVINLLYGLNGTGRPLGQITLLSQHLRPEGTTDAVNVFGDTWFANVPSPLPAAFIQGIDVQKRDFERGYPSYLMGEWKHGGWWYYYLVGFLVKEPLGFQILLYVSILHGLRNWKKWTRHSIRYWTMIVLPPVVIFALVSSQTGFNHHIRYVLPAYPFLFIIAARTFTLGRFCRWLTYACLTWQAAAVLWFAPHWMSYFNEAAGGPKKGHAWMLDSNIDWGQDILMLKWWQDKHPDVDLQAALFTVFDPKDIGLKYRLPAPYIEGNPEIVSKDGLRGPQPGWYAVSVCQLKGQSFRVPQGDGSWTWSSGHFTWLMDHFEPVDMIGYSIYIYHITEQQAEQVRKKLVEQESRQPLESQAISLSVPAHRNSGS
jgi:4-amino-4-deoxy-L-arabinose transferase-like glycosyltransferase